MAAFSTPIHTVFKNGEVVAGAKVFTYYPGSTTLLTTYSDAGLTAPNTNPIIADANGQVVIYIPTTSAMKIVEETAEGEYIRTIPVAYPTANFTSGIASEAVLPAAAETDLGSTGSNLVRVTGTTTITSLGNSASTGNPIYYVRFSGTLVLTHNGTSLQLPGAANITTSAGANAIFQYLGEGNWACLFYQTATGAPLQAPAQILLATQVVSSPVASVEFTTGLDSTYSRYLIVASNILVSSPSANLYAQMRRTTYLATGYHSTVNNNYVGSNSPASQANANFINLTQGATLADTDDYLSTIIIEVINPSDANARPAIGWEAKGRFYNSGPAYVSGSAYNAGVVGICDGLKLYPSAGNFTSGTFKLYGIN